MRHKGFFVTGVGTGIGKTVAAGAIAHLLARSGLSVGAMKPVQTGAVKKDKELTSPDLEFVQAVSGAHDPKSLAVPYLFRHPLSPYHAARKEKRKINPQVIEDAFEGLTALNDAVIVEGAGGLMVPLTSDIFWPDLVKRLGLPVIVVTHPELGMIHQVISTVLAAEVSGLEVAGLMIVHQNKNKKPDVDKRWLEKQTGCPVLGELPWLSSVKEDGVNITLFRQQVEKHLSSKPLLNILERRGNAELQKSLQKKDLKNVWHPFTQTDDWKKDDILFVDSGTGVKLKDMQGREYYDGMAAYWVNVHGHGHTGLTRTLARQSAKLEHSTFLGLSHRPGVELAEKLVEITPKGLNKVFYSDNGSTAVEVAMKMAVQYFRQTSDRQPKKTKFMALGSAYHGDTLGAVAVGGVAMYRKVFGPLLADVVFAPSPYCYRCPMGKEKATCNLACADEMDRLVLENKDRLAAFVIEPMVQCPGGIITSPPGYLKRVRSACTRHNILMIADEVATGFGRTGRMFACEHEGVKPDMMAIAKGMGAGLVPIAATMATDRIYDAFNAPYGDGKTFFHGHTFTAHPPACAVALENLELFRKNRIIGRIGESAGKLEKLLKRFEQIGQVGDIRQIGFATGIEIVKNRDGKEPFSSPLRIGRRIMTEARERGLIVRPLGDVMVFFPILAATGRELTAMTDILYESIATAVATAIREDK